MFRQEVSVDWCRCAHSLELLQHRDSGSPGLLENSTTQTRSQRELDLGVGKGFPILVLVVAESTELHSIGGDLGDTTQKRCIAGVCPLDDVPIAHLLVFTPT
jgi:hypothetical protein